MRSNSKSWAQVVSICFAAFALVFVTACNKVTPGDLATHLTATEQASNVRCARGLSRVELVGGVEDGFVATNSEPSRIRRARLPNDYLESIATAQSGALQLRDYDEAGQDKILIDHFEVPRDIVSGAIVVGLRTTGGSANDGFRLGNLDERDFIDGFGRTESFAYNFKKEAETPNAVTAGVVAVAKVGGVLR